MWESKTRCFLLQAGIMAEALREVISPNNILNFGNEGLSEG